LFYLFSYSIISGNANNSFTIGNNSWVRVGDLPLDYEEKSEYFLEIVATDSGNPPLTTLTTLKIHVIDLNDHQPEFTSQNDLFLNLNQSLPVGSSVGVVKATDGDGGRNGALHYVISSGDFGYFTIDFETGELFLVKQLNCFEVCAFFLVITVRDNGESPRASNTTAVINVQRVQQTVLVKQHYSVEIPENVTIGSKILQIETRIPNTLQAINFEILGNRELFDCNKDGVISIKKSLMNHRQKPNIILYVKCTTKRNGNFCLSQFEMAVINITILDLNNHRPIFTKLPVFYVSESTNQGSSVGQLSAQDQDYRSNARLTYSMMNASSDIFHIQADGQIHLLQPLDFETTKEYELQVEVRDHGSPSLTNIQKVYIFVQDSNDHKPRFQQQHSYNISIPTNIENHQEIVQIEAVDLDSGANGLITYRLTNFTDFFFIELQNGIVGVKNNTLFEHGDLYVIGISAKDSGQPSLEEVTTLLVHIYEINTSPRFTQDRYILNITENQGPLPDFFKLQSEDSDKALTNRRHKYQIRAPNDVLVYFSIDDVTGALSLLKPVDREEISDFIFQVVLHDEGKDVDEAEVKVDILDVNDFPPVVSPNQRGSIFENSPMDTYVMKLQAYDKDIGVNAQLHYSILNNNIDFKIDEKNGIITARRPFDYENKAEYNITVRVSDSAVPYLSVISNITISITDINDCPPRFTGPIDIIVPVSSPPGTYLTSLKIQDDDSDIHPSVKFSTPSNDVFVDIEAGDVTLATIMGNKAITIQIVAEDTRYPSFKDTTTLTVRPLGSSFNFPIIQNYSAVVWITENDQNFLQKPFHQIHTTKKNNLNTWFSIDSTNTDIFMVDEKSGELRLRKPLDYETRTWHVIWIGVRNQNNSNIKSHAKVVVLVNDVSDFVPQFEQSEITIKIKENTLNTFITKVTATDADITDVVYYFLEDSTHLEINRTSGLISRKTVLDYETIKRFTTMVYASNDAAFDVTTSKIQPNQVEFGQIILTIVIENINDNAPRFLNEPSSLTLPEDYPIKKVIRTFAANDADESDDLQYCLQQQVSSYFQLNPWNGQLSLLKGLDREQDSKLPINITVSDGKHVTIHSLVLFITDINDSPPQFKTNNILVEFPENTKKGVQVFEFRADDDDEGVNALSEFEYTTNVVVVVDDNFLLHKNGSFVTRSVFNLTKNKPLQYHFTIRARNTASPYFNTVAKVTVNVQDVNDHAPVFDSRENYKRVVSADVKLGETIIQVHATDNFDSGKNAQIRYHIRGGNASSLLKIDTFQGRVTTKASIFQYISKTLVLEIEASDLGTPSLKSSCFVVLSVEAPNKYSPQVFNAPYFKSIYENHTINKAILRIEADDYESRKALLFEIEKGNEDSKWKIFNNGSLVLVLPLDYEVKKSHNLVIRITDDSISNPKSIPVDVKISIRNVNDEAPTFQKQRYNTIVFENFNISQPVLVMNTSDKDSPPIKLTYSIVSPTGMFSINSKTGAIYATQPFDYEQQQLYRFQVQAEDNGEPSLKNIVQVTINISDVNEFKPQFPTTITFFNISRIQPIGRRIGEITASDKDLGNGADCIYKSTLPVQHGLIVDSITGEISVVSRLLPGDYVFQIIVFNRNDLTFYDVTAVHVHVFSFLGSPVFRKDVYEVEVLESVSPQSVLLTVSAKHYDGNNGIAYGVVTGSRDFAIGKDSGNILLLKALDFEVKRFYELTIFAVFGDSPRGFARVQVRVIDINDNAPKLFPCTGNIVENVVPRTTIISKLNVTDADDFPNAGPFYFSLMNNLDRFVIDKKTGEIKNKVLLNREEKSFYKVTVQVRDNGQPRLVSQTECTIEVFDVNDNQGKPRQLTIYGTVDSIKKNNNLGDVSPIDPDSGDRYNCSMESGSSSSSSSSSQILSFTGGTCILRASITNFPKMIISTKYFGQHGTERPIESAVTVITRRISETWHSKYVTIFFPRVTSKYFVSKLFVRFEGYLNQEIAGKLDSSPRIYVVSVQNYQNGAAINIVTSKPSTPNQDLLNYYIEQNRNRIKSLLGLQDPITNFDACVFEPCKGSNLLCKSQLHFYGYLVVNTPQLIFHSRKFSVGKQCRCNAGHVGLDCSRIPRLCSDNPCLNNGKCSYSENLFDCICPKEFEGKFCQNDVNECLALPCQNGGQCINKHGGFFCLCKGKYSGEFCEQERLPCASSPCLNNSTCIDELSEAEYKCECKFGDWGIRCESRSLNFGPVAYLEIPTDTPIVKLEISFEFSTVESEALLSLVYIHQLSFVISVKSRYVYVSLVTSTETVSIKSDFIVSDGKFHLLTIRFDNKVRNTVCL